MTTPPVTVPPIEQIEGQPLYSINDAFYLAATIWGEARGEGPEGMRQVAHVIRNRVKANKPKTWGSGYPGVVTHSRQFSCWNKSDPNAAKLNRSYLDTKLTGKDAVRWRQAQEIAQDVLMGETDITKGATYYHTTAISPYWTRTTDSKGRPLLTKLATIGNHVFYV